MEQKQIEIENKVRGYYNDLENSRNQILRYQVLLSNLQTRQFRAGLADVLLRGRELWDFEHQQRSVDGLNRTMLINARRMALPDANPGLYLTASLALTFPFNLILGIPLYAAMAAALYG